MTEVVSPARGARAEADPSRVRFRRALSLMVMTLLVPGSAQLIAGHRRVGRIALRIWGGLWIAAGLLALLWWLDRSIVLGIFTSPTVLGVLRIGLVVLALGWVALFADAWRLGAPLELTRRDRLTMSGISAALCFVTAGSLFVAAHLMAVQRDFITTVFGSTVVREADEGRYNVLLLGGDSGDGRWGLRPDSMTVASVEANTGDVVLVGLPRNLANVPFPEDSPMHEHFPDGFDCDGCYLNSINTWVADNAEEFDGIKQPGLEATRETIEEITGLPVTYYAMVNMRGLSKLVDAVGGVKVKVREPVAIGGIGSPITGYIPKGKQRLDGREALWYARSRVENSDYSRMARQKCLMNAMLQQLDPQTVLLKATAIADSSKRMLRTDIPAADLDRFVDLALRARDANVSVVSLVPPAVNTSDPDFDEIRSMVETAIERSENGAAEADAATAEAEKKAKKGGAGASDAGTSEETSEETTREDRVNAADDLGASC
ncbi:LCP family protein required for cell wall assembly [Mumia flava]|uniref:LCP family protein required for cell wall assembly n=1 Tax=Mumia flava TaxID=1348852 RepID=A0A2M9BKS5_9ACTN|nr:LCP family protein [Mumia flava]PJJ58525.1 LCP family protein required for cell wall assembly [Mumia flava]